MGLVFLTLVSQLFAASLHGKSLTSDQFAAVLELDKGKPVKGKIKFRTGTKAIFRAHDGTEVQIRIRPICAHGAGAELETCWPELLIEMDDVSARTGKLKISETP